MEGVLKEIHFAEFAEQVGGRFEEGTRFFNALFENAELLGIEHAVVNGKPVIDTHSFVFWVVDRYQLLVKRGERERYKGIGKAAVEFYIQLQIHLLRRQHQVLLRAG